MDLAEVMDEVATRLKGIADLNVFAYPPAAITPPAAIVDFPEVSFDETYGRGLDRLSLPVRLVVARAFERSTRDRLVPYCAGSGAQSFKQVLESGTYNAFDTLRVSGVEFGMTEVGGTPYASALFTLDITGPGST